MDFLNLEPQQLSRLNNLTIFVTLLLASVTVLGWLSRIVSAGLKARRLKELVLSGIYAGERDNKANDGWLFEIIDIRVVLDRVRGKSLYVHREGEEYLFNATRAKVHPNVLLGTWRSLRDSENYGDVLWNVDRNGTTVLVGCWAGTTRRGKVNFGSWRLTQCSPDVTRAVRWRLSPTRRMRAWLRIRKLLRLDRPNDAAIGQILEKHKQDDARIFQHGGYTYNIAQGVFNPRYGKVSVSLMDIVMTQGLHADARTVLDWGTGCGFYAITIACTQEFSANGGHVWALECNRQALACARNNVARFALGSHIDVIEGHNPRIIQENRRPKRFDLILANLPFTIAPSDSKHATEPMFSSFCTTYRGILEMAVAFRSHLSDGGRALLAYGDSGDVEWLDTCLGLTGLIRIDIATIDRTKGATDDSMYIFEIRRAVGFSELEGEDPISQKRLAYPRSA